MKDYLLPAAILLIVMSSFGCAKNVVVTTPADDAVRKETIKLECKSPHRQGCRYHGKILPWNEWTEVLGYSKDKYAVTERKPVGSVVIVEIEKR